MDERLTKEQFNQQLNTRFRIEVEPGNPLELEIVKVMSLFSAPHNEQFSVELIAPANRPLEQATYVMEHEALGTQHIFITPIARDDKGLHYEAVFNYLL
jgi:Domain of unknown function (DUF6916)